MEVWSVCGFDGEGNSEWLTDCYRQRDAVDEAAHYAFDESGGPCRAKVVEVYTKQGKLKKTYTRESYNSTRFWERHERVFVVEVEMRVMEAYVVAAKALRRLVMNSSETSQNGRQCKRVKSGCRLIDVKEMTRRRIK